jgi:tRNA (guanine-N7-)-methyltransferase
LGKNKLQRFAENLTFDNFFQPTYDEISTGYFLKGKWASDFFKNNNPIVLELGCGKGEYSVGLARRYPDKNFIGLDIKGARMWRGCKTSVDEHIQNIAFLRTRIELIEHYFAENEISEIWITFPDPQPRRIKENKRLTSPAFLKRYASILKTDGIIHLKTDAFLLYFYTIEIIKENNHHILISTDDLYHSGIEDDVMGIQTFYEQFFLAQGKKINYIKFQLNHS